MRLIDIRVGEEYACGHNSRRLGRVRVVATHVRGEVPSGYSTTLSSNTYVEVEELEPGRMRLDVPLHAHVDVLLEDLPGTTWCPPQSKGYPYLRGRSPEKRDVKTRKAIRVPARFIVRPWSEQVAINAEHAEAQERWAAQKKAEDARRGAALATILKHAGVDLENDNVGTENLERLAAALASIR